MEEKNIINGIFEKKKTTLILSIIGIINLVIGIVFSIWVYFNEEFRYYYSVYPVAEYDYVPYYQYKDYPLFFFRYGRVEGFGYFIVLGLLLIAVAGIVFWRIGKSNLSITDKHVKGQTFFGTKFALATETISAVEEVKFLKGIKIISASKKVTLSSLNNAPEIFKAISDLIVTEAKYKKEDSNVKNSGNDIDDFKKYKELLDIGAITQEEFDAKKKELLNL